jgi:HTH-type transcriptional regulator/antitoxin HigA
MNEMTKQEDLQGEGTALVDFELLARKMPLRSAADYDQAVTVMNWLLDDILADEAHPLRGALNLLSEQIHQYDRIHYRLPDPAPHELLQFMMEQREVTIADMAEVAIGEQLAAMLAGEREIDAATAQRMGQFFGLPADLFAPAGLS